MYVLLFQKAEDNTKTCWDDRSELCSLKVSQGRELYFVLVTCFELLLTTCVTVCCGNLFIYLFQILHIPVIFGIQYPDQLLLRGNLPSVVALQIFGLKTLVKSYLPVKDAHLRLGIENLLGILKNILFYGEISKDIVSRYFMFLFWLLAPSFI